MRMAEKVALMDVLSPFAHFFEIKGLAESASAA